MVTTPEVVLPLPISQDGDAVILLTQQRLPEQAHLAYGFCGPPLAAADLSPELSTSFPSARYFSWIP